VDGRSGSGKTTLAERIRGAVPASTVVHTDDVAWSQAMFDWTDLPAAPKWLLTRHDLGPGYTPKDGCLARASRR
jgi:hypothetical protein